MIEFKAKKPDIKFLVNGKVEISFITEKSIIKQFEGLNEEIDLTVQVKEFRQKRSLSQNAYMWVLLDEIGKVINRSKEDVYKELVKDYGVFEIIPLKDEAVERFNHNWSSKGLGWFTEKMGTSKIKGYTNLIIYYGSSTYNTKEMNRLLDAVLFECEELGINTMTLEEIMLLSNDNERKDNNE